MKALEIEYKNCGKFTTLKEDFLVYKAVRGAIVQLLLPKGTIISVPPNYNKMKWNSRESKPVGSRKLRATQAIVVGIFPFDETKYTYLKIADIDTEFRSIWDRSFTYKIGEVVNPHRFNRSHTGACSAGIHFFCDIKDAEKWATR